MEWTSFFAGKLDEVFNVVQLEGPDGALYGAGSPVDAVDILRLAVGAEEMEHYAEVLSDGWGMFHLLDQNFGLDPLIVFDFEGLEGLTTSVRYDLLDAEGDKVFVSVKVEEAPLVFLAAADRSALGDLLSSLMLTLLGTDTAFGDLPSGNGVPISVVNYRPDLVKQASVRKGIELLAWRRSEVAVSSVQSMLDHVRRFGNPILKSVLGAEEWPDTEAARRDLVDLYFESAYSESD